MFLKKVFPLSLRGFHTSIVVHGEVNKQLLSKLRKSTGIPFIKCSQALEKFDNNITEAEKWLKEQAQKEGWTKATKLQGRPMSQGLIGLSVSENVASMVEVNCETDFVARNVNFQNLVNMVTQALSQHGKENNISKASLNQSQLAELRANDKKISDLTALEVGNLGENMLVRRGILLKPADGQMMSAYVHSTGAKLQLSNESFLLGKYGALVVYEEDPSIKEEPTGEDQESILTLDDLGKQLCQHVVGMNPTSIGSFDDGLGENPQNELKEKTQEEIEEKKQEGEAEEKKQEEEEEKMQEKVKEKPQEEKRLLHQDFMFDDSMLVKDVLKKYGVRVTDFIRIECGEEIIEEAEPESSKALGQ